MNTTRTFSIVISALALVSGTPLFVVAAQEPAAVAKTQESTESSVPAHTHHQLGLQF